MTIHLHGFICSAPVYEYKGLDIRAKLQLRPRGPCARTGNRGHGRGGFWRVYSEGRIYPMKRNKKPASVAGV